MGKSSLIRSISYARLSSYRHAFNCTDEEALHYYYWNQVLSSELYILTHNIEICFRNQIHNELSKEVSFVKKGNTLDNFNWFDFFEFLIPDANSPSGKKLNQTGEAFKKIKKDLIRKNVPTTPQNIVSNLEFGKWAYILRTRSYNDGKPIDWVKCLAKIFPNLNTSKKKNREAMNATPDEILKRLEIEIYWATTFLKWLCEDTYNSYIKTNSYKKLLKLITIDGISDFEL